MTSYYSPSENAFYESSINTNIPEDVLEITTSRKKELFVGQSKGLSIVPGEDGYPVNEGCAVDIDRNLEIVWRNSELFRADIELLKVQDSDPKAIGTVSQWRDYRKALRTWPENPDFPDKQKRPVSPKHKD